MPGDYERTNKLAAQREQKEEDKNGTGGTGSKDQERDDALRDALRLAPPLRAPSREPASPGATSSMSTLPGKEGEGPNKRGRIHEPGLPHNLEKMETKGKGDCGYKAIGMQHRMLLEAKAGGAMPEDTEK